MALARALSALTSEQLLALLVCTLADGHDDSLSSISSPHALAYASCSRCPAATTSSMRAFSRSAASGVGDVRQGGGTGRAGRIPGGPGAIAAGQGVCIAR